MTATPIPTRSQLNNAMEFFASYAGAAYKDGGAAELQTDMNLAALREAVVIDSEGGTGILSVHLPEEMIQRYIELWLRANWEEIVDYMVDSHCAIEDAIEDKQCPKPTAHGGHYWDASLFPEHFGPTGGDLIEWHCEGVKVHPRCMIAGGHNADA